MSKLIVGLGNPGATYTQTRHNAGFWFLEALAKIHHQTFSYHKKFDADWLTIANGVHLLKPLTFMNKSGSSVLSALQFYDIATSDMIVIHDEVDLPVGSIKIKLGGGDAGHRGLQDITQRLQSNHYWRVRLGVGKPDCGEVRDYVLHPPSSEEKLAIGNAIEFLLEKWDLFLTDDYNRVIGYLHTRNNQLR